MPQLFRSHLYTSSESNQPTNSVLKYVTSEPMSHEQIERAYQQCVLEYPDKSACRDLLTLFENSK